MLTRRPQSLVEAVLESRREAALENLKPEDFRDRSFKVRMCQDFKHKEAARLREEARRLNLWAKRRSALDRLLGQRARLEREIAEAEARLAEVEE